MNETHNCPQKNAIIDDGIALKQLWLARDSMQKVI